MTSKTGQFLSVRSRIIGNVKVDLMVATVRSLTSSCPRLRLSGIMGLLQEAHGLGYRSWASFDPR